MIKGGYTYIDIKPENYITHKSVQKVADFGFATKTDITGR